MCEEEAAPGTGQRAPPPPVLEKPTRVSLPKGADAADETSSLLSPPSFFTTRSLLSAQASPRARRPAAPAGAASASPARAVGQVDLVRVPRLLVEAQERRRFTLPGAAPL